VPRAGLPGVDVAGLSAGWARAWGGCRPLSYELRGCLHDRWVRFHSLPGSKRYADNDDEYAELMRRHLTVLAELLCCGSAGEASELVVVTASWTDSPGPAPRDTELAGILPAAAYWTSVLSDDSEPGTEIWTHLWLSAARLHSEELARLLRLVADDGKNPSGVSSREPIAVSPLTCDLVGGEGHPMAQSAGLRISMSVYTLIECGGGQVEMRVYRNEDGDPLGHPAL
jgi:hypothetical protein